jgi:hypothetical protein
VFAVVFLVALVGACSAPRPADAGSGDAGSADASVPDASVPTDAGVRPAALFEVTLAHGKWVRIPAIEPVTTYRLVAWAMVRPNAEPPERIVLARDEEGTCSFEEYEYDFDTPMDAGVLVPPLGKVTVTGGLLPEEGLVISEVWPHGSVLMRDAGWNDGDVLQVEAAAGVREAVPPTALRTPRGLVLTHPAVETGILTLSSSTPLELTWTNGDAQEDAVFTLDSTGSFESERLITCRFPARDGRGVIPARLIAKLGQMDGTYRRGWLYAWTTVEVVPWSDAEWEVRFRARASSQPEYLSLRLLE